MGSFRDLAAYRKAFKLSMDVFQETKKFPKEEMFSLTDQIRRSSRSVCANIGEAYRKRKKYPKHFISKLAEADSENTETEVWADFSLASIYIQREKYNQWISEAEEVGRLLNFMMENPGKFS